MVDKFSFLLDHIRHVPSRQGKVTLKDRLQGQSQEDDFWLSPTRDENEAEQEDVYIVPDDTSIQSF